MIGAPIASLLDELPGPERVVENNQLREDGLDKLKSIKSALHVMKATEIKRQLDKKQEKLNIILNYILSPLSNREEVSVCIDILSVCVEALDGDSLYSAFQSNLSNGLSSQNKDVVLLCIKTINAVVERGKKQIEPMLSDHSLLSCLSKCMNMSLEVSNKAANLLKKIMNKTDLITKLALWQFLENELRSSITDDIIKIRVQELLVDCCVENETVFNSVSTWQLFEELVQDSVSDDVLIQLNTFVVLSKLASSEHGFEYLQNKNVLHNFSEILSDVDSHPFSNLILPGLLKFFGGICQHKPDKVLSQHPQFISKLFTQMSLGDTLALETTAFIAKGASGKRILNSRKGPFYSICLHLTGSLCHSSDANQRVTGFMVASDLFHLNEKDTDNNEISTMLKDWWFNLGLTWNYLLEQLQNPFQDVQIAIHQLLAHVLPYHFWALQSFANSAGFMEYILGRQTGSGRGTLLSKYDLVCKLADSQKARETFGDPYYVKLQGYKSNGPYYAITGDPQVAVERGD